MKGKATTTGETKSDRKESIQQTLKVTKAAYVIRGDAIWTTLYNTNCWPGPIRDERASPIAERIFAFSCTARSSHEPRAVPNASCGHQIRGRPISEHCWREKRTKKQVLITFTCHGKPLHLAVECRGMNQSEDVSLSVPPFISCFYFCM